MVRVDRDAPAQGWGRTRRRGDVPRGTRGVAGVLVPVLVALLAGCGGAGSAAPTGSGSAQFPAAGRGTTPAVHQRIVVPDAPTFTEPGSSATPSPGSTTTAAPVDPLLPTREEAAGWSTAELVAWAGQLDGFTLPADGAWRTLSIALQYAHDGSEQLDGIEADLTVASAQSVDDLVTEQIASPPRGSTVLDVLDGEDEDDGRRTVSVVLHTAGASADSVDLIAQAGGGSLLHAQHLPRRDGTQTALSEERVGTLVSRLTLGARPEGWRVRFARLTLDDTRAPAVMVAWSAPGLDEAQAMAAAQAAFGHLTFDPVEVNQYRTRSDFTYPAAATSGAISVSTESDGTTRVELEGRA